MVVNIEKINELNNNIVEIIDNLIKYYEIIDRIFSLDQFKDDRILIIYIIKNYKELKMENTEYKFDNKLNTFMISLKYLFIAKKIFNFYTFINKQSHMFDLSSISTSFIYNISEEYQKISTNIFHLLSLSYDLMTDISIILIDEHINIIYNNKPNYEIINSKMYVEIYEKIKTICNDVSVNKYKIDYFCLLSSKLIEINEKIPNQFNKIILFHLTNTFPDIIKNSILKLNITNKMVKTNHFTKQNPIIMTYGMSSNIKYTSLSELVKLLINKNFDEKDISLDKFSQICTIKNIHVIINNNVFKYPIINDVANILNTEYKFGPITEALLNNQKHIWYDNNEYETDMSVKFVGCEFDIAKHVLILETPNKKIYKPLTNIFPLSDQNYLIDKEIYSSLEYSNFINNNRLLKEQPRSTLINSLLNKKILENVFYTEVADYEKISKMVESKIPANMFKDINLKYFNILKTKLTEFDFKRTTKEKIIEYILFVSDEIIISIISKYISNHFSNQITNKENFSEILLSFTPIFNNIIQTFKKTVFDTLIKFKNNVFDAVIKKNTDSNNDLINDMIKLINEPIKLSLDLAINSDTNLFYKILMKNEIMNLK